MRFAAIVLTLMSLPALSQDQFITGERTGTVSEFPAAIITGEIKTTDGQPAAFVTVLIKENNKTAITNEEGRFIVKNLKSGAYTLEISMAGLKAQE